MIVTDFIDSHNYPGSNREKDASLLLKSRIEARSIAATPFRQLTEEEELQQAIAASLHESCTKSGKNRTTNFSYNIC